ncbi:high potential iron sulfur protein [Afifella sp. IM 167]|uniref:high potential iron sulfur protein n=1 Tax=Afifella sp. IM 167 TaxID=2033586 RepID=UPI001CCC8D38|nr:high potential iron sulfur protein [Afifella sp. IM 167]MBZ8131713.1 high potential iron sulfur protein [Afifella sp. IM 167]
MSDGTKKPNGSLSRRELLAASVLAASSLAILGAGSAEAQLAKKAKQNIAGYQTTPKGRQQCDNCRHFQAPNACQVVESPISPTGWCRLYAKK